MGMQADGSDDEDDAGGMSTTLKAALLVFCTPAVLAVGAARLLLPAVFSQSMTGQHSIAQKPTEPKFFQNKQKMWLYQEKWACEKGKPKGVIVLCHGCGEHIGRYKYVARFFAARGYEVWGMDHQGHGRSGGERVFVNSFKDYVDDFLQFSAAAKEQHPALPLFVFSNSMGGLINGFAACRANAGLYRGCVMNGPAIFCAGFPNKVREAAGRLIAAAFPRAKLGTIDVKYVCGTKAVRDQLAADPLVWHGALAAGFLRRLFGAMHAFQGRQDSVRWPFLVMHGEHERLENPAKIREFFDRAASRDKQMRVWPGLYHETFQEQPGRDQVLGAAADWYDARL